MFASRAREDLRLAGKNAGLLDALARRIDDALWIRRRWKALRAWFTPRKSMTATLFDGGPMSVAGVGRCRLECLTGRAWVTAGNGGRDYALAPGQRLVLADVGMIVVSAVNGPSRVRLDWA